MRRCTRFLTSAISDIVLPSHSSFSWRRPDLVDPDELDELISPCLVGGHDTLGSEKLDHAFVSIVRSADGGVVSQRSLQLLDRHKFGRNCPSARNGTQEPVLLDRSVVRNCRKISLLMKLYSTSARVAVESSTLTEAIDAC